MAISHFHGLHDSIFSSPSREKIPDLRITHVSACTVLGWVSESSRVALTGASGASIETAACKLVVVLVIKIAEGTVNVAHWPLRRSPLSVEVVEGGLFRPVDLISCGTRAIDTLIHDPWLINTHA